MEGLLRGRSGGTTPQDARSTGKWRRYYVFRRLGPRRESGDTKITYRDPYLSTECTDHLVLEEAEHDRIFFVR